MKAAAAFGVFVGLTPVSNWNREKSFEKAISQTFLWTLWSHWRWLCYEKCQVLKSRRRNEAESSNSRKSRENEANKTRINFDVVPLESSGEKHVSF